MASPRWWLTLAGVALLSLGIRGTPARADVVPGDKINEQNMDKLKDLISPGMEWVIKHGWPITITETKRIEFLGNKDLLINTVDWLAREPQAISRRPRMQELGVNQFYVSSEQGDRLFWITAVLEPVLFAAIGLVLAARRRWE